jgi:hypothetical protein
MCEINPNTREPWIQEPPDIDGQSSQLPSPGAAHGTARTPPTQPQVEQAPESDD